MPFSSYARQTAGVAAANAASASSSTAWPSTLVVNNWAVCTVALSGSSTHLTPTVSAVSLGTDALTLVTGAAVTKGSGSTGIRVEIWAGQVKTSSQQTLTVTASAACNIEAIAAEYDGSAYTITLSGSAVTDTGTSATAATTSLSPSDSKTLRIAAFAAQTTLNGTLSDSNQGVGGLWIAEGSSEQAGSGGTGACGVALADVVQGFGQTTAPTLGLGASTNWASVQIAFLQGSSSALVSGFIGHTYANTNNANSQIGITTPAGIATGDLMLVWVTAFNSMCGAPAGWTQIGSSISDSNGGNLALFWKLYAASDGTSITFGSSNLSFAQAVMRVYRGYFGIDAHGSAFTSGGPPTSATSLQVPALAATLLANETYVAQWTLTNSETALRISDLGDVGFDSNQWVTWEGDKIVTGAAGTVPAAETLSFQPTSSDATVIAVTLKPGSTVGTGSSSGHGTVTGHFAATGRFKGTASGQGTVAGQFAGISRGRGASTGSATVTGRFTAKSSGRGTAAGIATIVGHLSAMTGAANGQAVVTGHFAAIGRFTGAAVGSAALSGKIQGFINITGASVGAAVIAGRLAARTRGRAASAGAATVSGRFAAIGVGTGQALGQAVGNGRFASIDRFAGNTHAAGLGTALSNSLNRILASAAGSGTVVGRFHARTQATGASNAHATVVGHLIGSGFYGTAAGVGAVVGYSAARGSFRVVSSGSATILGRGAARSTTTGSSVALAAVNGRIVPHGTGVGSTAGQATAVAFWTPLAGLFIGQGDPAGQAIVLGYGASSTTVEFGQAIIAANLAVGRSETFNPKNFIIHTTTVGQRWDTLAWIYYGDATLISPIIQANPQISIEAVFETGLVIGVPILTVKGAVSDPNDLPPWEQAA